MIIDSLPLFVLNIILPTVDIYSDLALVIQMFLSSEASIGGILLVPFLLNYLLTWIVWWRIDKMKKISFISTTLSCYPQFCAAKVIYAIFTNSGKTEAMKKELRRDVAELEVFVESVFSTLIITFLLMRGGGTFYSEVVSDHPNLFYLSYATSLLSASYGMAKSLKEGPCRILADNGEDFGGLLNGRFLLLFISVAATFASKWAVIVQLSARHPVMKQLSTKQPYWAITAICLSLCIPLISLCRYKESVKSIIRHPSLLLLPVFTFYTFSSFSRNDSQKIQVKFSWRFTLANIICNLFFYALGIGEYIVQSIENNIAFMRLVSELDLIVIMVPVIIVGAVLTLLVLFLCNNSCCIPLQYGVLIPSEPLVDHVEVQREGLIVVMKMDDYLQKSIDLEIN